MNSNYYQQIPLLDIEQYTNTNSPVYTYDPYWDELQQEQLSSETIENTHSQISKNSSAPEHREVVEQFFLDDNEPGNFIGNHDSHGTSAPHQYKCVGEQVFLATKTHDSKTSVGEQVASYTEKSAPQHDKATHWVEKYWVNRSGNKHWYYRYMWMCGRKINRVYIGSVRSRLAQSKVELVREAISDDQSPSEIKRLISSVSSLVVEYSQLTHSIIT